MKKKYSIECWIYQPKSAQFLLLQCPATAHHPVYWQPVTGGRQDNESVLQCCQREVAEETGLQIDKTQLFTVLDCFSVIIADRDMYLEKPVYLYLCDTDKIQLSIEHIAYQWVDAKKIVDFLYWESNKTSFMQVWEYLQSKW